jgi:hypothetical protein
VNAVRLVAEVLAEPTLQIGGLAEVDPSAVGKDPVDA